MGPVPFTSERWTGGYTRTEHLGRECALLGSSTSSFLATVAGLELVDGTIEAELAVGRERSFHGVVWRVRDDENYESFFVRPHQVGNDDAIQYTPVFNGISSWQLYHGPGFWAPIAFPLDEWFRIRVVFSGERAEVYVADLDEPALTIRGLKGPVQPGRVGLLVGGTGLHVSEFACGEAAVLRTRAQAPASAVAGIVPAWWISDALREDAVGAAGLDLAGRTWTRLASESSGLVDLARVNGIRDGRNTVFARATIRSARAQTRALEFGFSDRAVVYLNGRALYRGDDSYRSRDYRFLGSIGYHDTLYLPLAEGDNELVVAVSESFGGWGVQARFPDPAGLALEEERAAGIEPA